MKNASLALLMLAMPAMAGVEVAPAPPPPAPSLWQWFAGGSVGYLLDAEEEIYHAHVGIEKTGGSLTHAFFLELGYAEGLDSGWAQVIGPVATPNNRDTNDWIGRGGLLSLDGEVEIMPLTLNYKIAGKFGGGAWGWYAGAGVGVAFIDVDYNASYIANVPAQSRLWRYSDDDTVFAAQAFAGLTWNPSQDVQIYTGFRYIYIDDPEFGVAPGLGIDVELDDYMFEIGARFYF